MHAQTCRNCGSADVQAEIRGNFRCRVCGATTDTTKES